MNMPQLTPRQRAREIAFQFLYRLDHDALGVSAQGLEKDFQTHASHFEIPKESYEFAFRLVKQVITSQSQIDELINSRVLYCW